MSDAPPFAPLVLLADSQPLFASAARPSILERLLPVLPDDPRAAYVGASNGDEPAFYELFEAAMDGVGIGRRAMVRSRYGEEDRGWLEGADLVVLAGGDVERGWRVFEQRGMKEALLERYAAGAVLVGVSAGAVQLGWGWLGLVGGWVGVHEEGEGWAGLRRLVGGGGARVRGFGVPLGGGLVVHGDGEFEVVGRGVVELAFGEDGEVRESLLLPAV